MFARTNEVAMIGVRGGYCMVSFIIGFRRGLAGWLSSGWVRGGGRTAWEGRAIGGRVSGVVVRAVPGEVGAG